MPESKRLEFSRGVFGRRSVGVMFVVILAVTLGAATGTAAADAPDCSAVSYNGDGTTSSPYEVGNVDQLQCIENQGLDAAYELVSDIDATGTSSWNFGEGFEPIGSNSNPFTGGLSGNGNTITGLTIARGGTNRIGLFGVIGNDGGVRGVNLEDVETSGNAGVGTLVGDNFGSILESSASGSATGSGNAVGGLVGHTFPQGTVSQSFANVDVTGVSNVGGLVGNNEGSVTNTYARGNVSGSNAGTFSSPTGGLVGETGGGSVTQSYATGTVSGSGRFSDLGGLLGSPGGVVDDSYWDVPASGLDFSQGGTGLGSSGDTPPADEMTGDDAPNNMQGFDFTNTWDTVPGEYPVLAWQTEGVSEEAAPDCSNVNYNGDGTQSNPYEVSNADQLQCVEEQGLGVSYEITSDIDATGTSSWNFGEGFEPIGSDSNPFTGGLSGNGNTITGLTIARGTNKVGLFGVIGNDGGVQGVNLEDVEISGGAFNTGALAGKNSGSILESSASGSVTGSGNNVGGLVGQTLSQGTVSRSFANVDVTGVSNVGGLVGRNEGSVTNTYARGNVSGSGAGNFGSPTGGLVGETGGGSVTQSYATGTVSGSGRFSDLGGLLGSPGGVVDDSYWDVPASGLDFSQGGTGLGSSSETPPADEMTGNDAPNNMQGFDFTNTWDTVTGPDGYPILAWQVEPTATFTVSPTNPETEETVTFDASGSSSPEGTIQTYEWDFDGDGTTDETTTTPTATTTYSSAGDFTVELTVTDNDGETDTTTQTVDVGSPLTASFTFSPSSPSTLDTVIFDASGSDGNIQSYSWDLGDGTTATGQTATHSYSSTGDFTVELTVTDNGGRTDTATMTVEVQSEDLFTDPLPGFNNPPQNTGDLDPNLYEDVDGDGDGTDPTQAVTLWTELVVNPQNFDDLTQEQIDALDWNGDGQLTPADAVSLWTEQVLA